MHGAKNCIAQKMVHISFGEQVVVSLNTECRWRETNGQAVVNSY